MLDNDYDNNHMFNHPVLVKPEKLLKHRMNNKMKLSMVDLNFLISNGTWWTARAQNNKIKVGTSIPGLYR